MKRTVMGVLAAVFALGFLCFAPERPAEAQVENEFLELSHKGKKDHNKDHGKKDENQKGHKKDHKKDDKKDDKKD